MTIASLKARLRKVEGKHGTGALIVYLAWGRTQPEALASVKVPVPVGHVCVALWPFDDEPVPAAKWVTDSTIGRVTDRELEALAMQLNEAEISEPATLDASTVARLRTLTDAGLLATALSSPAFAPAGRVR